MKYSKVICVLLIACVLLSGCSVIRKWTVTEDEVLGSKQPESVLEPEKSGWENVEFYLYYQVRDLVYMAPEMRSLSNLSEEEYLTAMINELLKGPKDAELHAWFPAGTTLVDVAQTQDYVYVTLSAEFLNAPKEAPINWSDDPDWKAYVQQRRRLALYSLINTVTQLGSVSRVQVLVQGEDGQTVRLSGDHVGMGDEDPTQPLAPLSREDSLIFTPELASMELLEAFSRKDWETVADWTASKDPLYGSAPDHKTIVTELEGSDPSLLQFDPVATQVVSGDLAVVTLRLEESGQSGVRAVYESQPLRWVKDGALWKISYTSLSQLIRHAK